MAASEGIRFILAIPESTPEQPQRYYVIRGNNKTDTEGKLAGKLLLDCSILAIANSYKEAVQIWQKLT